MSSLSLLWGFAWFALGAVIGSFLNVCVYRLPRGESLVFPGSRCPRCGRRLEAFELIPVISYLFLLGKCRGCRAPISPRYPLVELLTGLVFLLAAKQAGADLLWLGFAVIFASCLIVIFFIDLELQVIPDAVSLAGGAAGLIYNFVRGFNDHFLPALAGIAVGYLLFFLIARIGRLLFRQEALGEGDIYLAALLGAGLGWQGMLLAVLLGYFGEGLILGILLLAGRVKMGQAVPLGPALAWGGLVALFWGERIIHWYLSTPLL